MPLTRILALAVQRMRASASKESPVTVTNRWSLLGIALHVGFRNFLRVHQLQRHVFCLPRPHGNVLLPLRKHTLSGSSQIVVVCPQLGDREAPVGVRPHHVRTVAARRLVGHACVGHWLVIRPQHHTAQRGRPFVLRRGRYAAGGHEHQKKNR